MEARTPEFYNDDAIGKFGEELFIRDFKSQYVIANVSDIPVWQMIDVDFIITKTNLAEATEKWSKLRSDSFEDFNMLRNDKTISKVEVKTDTRSFDTRNVVYEIIANGKKGWAGCTEADYIYYVFVDGNKKNLFAREVWWINMMRWRDFVRVNFFDKNSNPSQFGIMKNNYDESTAYGKTTRVANLLCNIDVMQRYGIAIKLHSA